jgi:NOL1/NOP2/sun family putative RNA methylase
MSRSLGAEAKDFFDSYGSPRAYGLRRNPLKLSKEDFEALMPFDLSSVSWADEGYYYNEGERPGRHPYHEMGLYYIQEPSAMSVAAVADPKPGELVLDLCAAPGGKSTHLAGRMAGRGLLLCNEIVPGRAKILAQNIERMGIRNAVVVNHSPQELAARFPAFFDRIIVDAPCSGEGMFHKEEAALAEWSPENVVMCSERQREILTSAVPMLKAGGTLVYSTCTFAPAEDEEIVAWLLETFPELSLAPIDTDRLGISEGTIPGTGRIYPHRQWGEGHFLACLKKCGEYQPGVRLPSPERPRGKGKAKADPWKDYEAFAEKYLKIPPTGERLVFGDQLYLLPEGLSDISGLRVLRPGLHLGTNKKNRFEPGHALALALEKSQVSQCFETDEPEKFLRGETFSCSDSLEGWTLVTCHGLSMGWGKASRGMLKNHYPKGLRITW